MLSDRELEKARQDLVDLHKRVLLDYLIKKGLSFKGRKKFFGIYNHYINRRNITEYFYAPCNIFVRALIKDRLDLIKGISLISEANLKKYPKKHRKIVSF